MKTRVVRGQKDAGAVQANRSNGIADSAVVADVLDLLAAAIWADVTGIGRAYGSVPWGTEP